MNEGTVKFFDETKGFGFIKDKNSSDEYFVHASECVDKIKKDDKVKFDLRKGSRGMSAINVKLV